MLGVEPLLLKHPFLVYRLQHQYRGAFAAECVCVCGGGEKHTEVQRSKGTENTNSSPSGPHLHDTMPQCDFCQTVVMVIHERSHETVATEGWWHVVAP